VGTRYEELASSVMAMLKLAFIERYLRALEPSDTAEVSRRVLVIESTMGLQQKIGKKQAFKTPEEHAYLALRRSAWSISSEMSAVYALGGFTASQYNVLRILRGHHPTRLTASQIAPLMVSRDSDMTRIITELHKRRLVSRRRCDKDRRRFWIGITQNGLYELAELDRPVVEAVRSLFGVLDPGDLTQLIALLERICDSEEANA